MSNILYYFFSKDKQQLYQDFCHVKRSRFIKNIIIKRLAKLEAKDQLLSILKYGDFRDSLPVLFNVCKDDPDKLIYLFGSIESYDMEIIKILEKQKYHYLLLWKTLDKGYNAIVVPILIQRGKNNDQSLVKLFDKDKNSNELIIKLLNNFERWDEGTKNLLSLLDRGYNTIIVPMLIERYIKVPYSDYNKYNSISELKYLLDKDPNSDETITNLIEKTITEHKNNSAELIEIINKINTDVFCLNRFNSLIIGFLIELNAGKELLHLLNKGYNRKIIPQLLTLIKENSSFIDDYFKNDWTQFEINFFKRKGKAETLDFINSKLIDLNISPINYSYFEFSPDSKYLAVSENGWNTRLIRLNNYEIAIELKTSNNYPPSFLFTPDNKYLIDIEGSRFRITSLESMKVINEYFFYMNEYFYNMTVINKYALSQYINESVSLSNNSRFVAVSSSDPNYKGNASDRHTDSLISIIDLQELKENSVYKESDCYISNFKFSPDNKLLLFTSSSFEINVLRLSDNKLVYSLYEKDLNKFWIDDNLNLTIVSMHRIRVVSLNNFNEVYNLNIHSSEIVLSDDKKYLLTTTFGNRIYLYDLINLKEMYCKKLEIGPKLYITPDNKSIVTANYIYNLIDPSDYKKIDYSDYIIRNTLFCKKRACYIYVGIKIGCPAYINITNITIYNQYDLRVIFTSNYSGEYENVIISPSEKYILIILKNDFSRLIRLSDYEEVLKDKLKSNSDSKFSQDDNYFTYTKDGLHIVNLNTDV